MTIHFDMSKINRMACQHEGREGPTRAMTTGEVRFDEGRSALFAAQFDRVCHAYET
jgi:hypothetical protein